MYFCILVGSSLEAVACSMMVLQHSIAPVNRVFYEIDLENAMHSAKISMSECQVQGEGRDTKDCVSTELVFVGALGPREPAGGEDLDDELSDLSSVLHRVRLEKAAIPSYECLHR